MGQILLVDATPLTLGVEMLGGFATPLISDRARSRIGSRTRRIGFPSFHRPAKCGSVLSSVRHVRIRTDRSNRDGWVRKSMRIKPR